MTLMTFHYTESPLLALNNIGVGAQSTLEGLKIFARKICIKNQQNAEFYMILARKIIKIPKFV